jgi:hypothetical protein
MASSSSCFGLFFLSFKLVVDVEVTGAEDFAIDFDDSFGSGAVELSSQLTAGRTLASFGLLSGSMVLGFLLAFASAVKSVLVSLEDVTDIPPAAMAFNALRLCSSISRSEAKQPLSVFLSSFSMVLAFVTTGQNLPEVFLFLCFSRHKNAQSFIFTPPLSSKLLDSFPRLFLA